MTEQVDILKALKGFPQTSSELFERFEDFEDGKDLSRFLKGMEVAGLVERQKPSGCWRTTLDGDVHLSMHDSERSEQPTAIPSESEEVTPTETEPVSQHETDKVMSLATMVKARNSFASGDLGPDKSDALAYLQDLITQAGSDDARLEVTIEGIALRAKGVRIDIQDHNELLLAVRMMGRISVEGRDNG